MRLCRLLSAGAGCGLLMVAAAEAPAQPGNLGLVVRDGSIGPAIPPRGDGVVQPGDGASYLITPDLGEESGSNLFHSFEYFSIGESESARFTANSGTEVILGRVSGGEPSDILGSLESPNASLFLLNPFGVFFGENASVDVNGSFHVSTADQLNFESGAPLLTRESTPPVSLSSAPPASFGFLVDDPASIEFATEELCDSPCVPAGETFSVVGGDILIDGLDDNNRTIDVPGGQIQLVSVASAGVEVPLDASSLDVDAQPAGSFGEVRLQNRAILTVPSDGSAGTTGTGKIVIRGGRFVLAGSDLDAVAGRGSIDGQAIGIDVAVTDSIELTSYEGNLSAVRSSSRNGRSGDIHFSGDRFSMDDGSRILNQARDVPQGADVYIDANTIELSGVSPLGTLPTQIFARARARIGVGTRAGDTYLSGRAPGTADRAQSVSISDSARLLVTSEDAAAGGSIAIATESLTIDLGGEVRSITQENGTSGLIGIDAGDALVADGGKVLSLTEGQNDGANIDFAGEKLTVTRGGEISTQVNNASATGNGGGIDIAVGEVEVSDGGLIASLNFGEGSSGAIGIVAGESLTVSDEGQIFTLTGPLPGGGGGSSASSGQGASAASVAPPARTGGNLTIETGRLTVAGRQGAATVTQISTLTNAEGQAGSEDGRGGDLTIHAEQIDLINGGQLRATTLASAPAGTLHVHARGAGDVPATISIRGVVDRLEESGTAEPIPTPAGIFATSGEGTGSSATGAGGKALIEADIIDIADGGEIQSSTFGVGQADRLTVIAHQSIKVSGESGRSSKIVAQGDVGNGGDLVITTGLLEIIGGGEVSVTALTTGNSGNVTIAADRIVIRGENDETPSGVFAQSVSALSTGGDAGTIRLTTGELVVADGGRLAVTTEGGGSAGNIIAAAGDIVISNAGSVSAESRLISPAAGTAGNIDLRAEQNLSVSSASVTTETANAPGGNIRLSAGGEMRIDQQSEVSARANGDGAAGNIVVADTAEFTLADGSTMTAETTGAGQGGQIVFENVGNVLVTGGSSITTRSTGVSGGDAGSIAIAANGSFQIDQESEITTTAANAGGGRISIQAGKLVSLLDSKLETTVGGADDVAGADAGDIDITFRGDEPTDTSPTAPGFVVINRSTVRANAVATDAGNISITGDEVLISSDSVIEATSETGVSGNIQISSPDTDVVSQVTSLSATFVDPSDRLLPPCIARTERTGSFIVQNRTATQPSPDSPLSAGLGTAAGRQSPSDSVECSVFEEKI